MIRILGEKPTTVKDYVGGAWNETTGFYEDGTETTRQILAFIETFQKNELQNFEPAQRTRDPKLMITSYTVHKTDEHTGQEGTIVVFKGLEYIISAMEPIDSVLPHFECTLLRRDKQ